MLAQRKEILGWSRWRIGSRFSHSYSKGIVGFERYLLCALQLYKVGIRCCWIWKLDDMEITDLIIVILRWDLGKYFSLISLPYGLMR